MPGNHGGPLGLSFDLPDRYQIVKRLGEGAFGLVVAAKDKQTGKLVAIKKIKDACNDEQDLIRLLRELKSLRHLRGHENFISIRDLVLSPNGKNFQDIYIITDLMDTDLHRIIRSHQQLTDEHVRYFTYQLLRGLKYIHSANVMHRDLKPNNLLVNANCDLKICDLGLARAWDNDESNFTCYVVTRWYRAPELMLGSEQYTYAIDMWSVGCILAELISRTPLFPGKDYVEMLKMIVATIGNPVGEELSHVSEKAVRFLGDRSMFPESKGVSWKERFPNANDKALDMLRGLLQFSPTARLTVEEALSHPYMHELHDSDDEPSADAIFDFAFEKENASIAQLRELVVLESQYISCPRRGRARFGLRRSDAAGAAASAAAAQAGSVAVGKAEAASAC